MYRIRALALTSAFALVVPTVSSLAFTENFSADPFSAWSFGVGGTDPSTNRFVWNSAAAPAYTGDATGALAVHLNSSQPTVRFDRPLGVTLTDTDSFTLSTRFSYALTSAPDDQFMQIAFGLVNNSLTGGDRTGSAADFASDNVFHTIEFAYFPNVSTLYGGPTLSPAVFGAQKSGGDAFNNLASIFGPGSNLGDNTIGITTLPTSLTLQATLTYSGNSKVLTLNLSRVNGDGSLTPLVTEVPALNLTAAGYYSNFPFVVNTLAVMAYNDGFTSSGAPSLVADVTFQQFDFAIVPEPATVTLLAGGLMLLGCGRRFRQKYS